VVAEHAFRDQIRDDMTAVVRAEMQQLQEWFMQQVLRGQNEEGNGYGEAWQLAEFTNPSPGTFVGSSYITPPPMRPTVNKPTYSTSSWEPPGKAPAGDSSSAAHGYKQGDISPPPRPPDDPNPKPSFVRMGSHGPLSDKMGKMGVLDDDDKGVAWQDWGKKQMEAKILNKRGKWMQLFGKYFAFTEDWGNKPMPDNWLSKFAESGPFTSFFSLLIVVNTLFVGIEVHFNMRRVLEDPEAVQPKAYKYVGYCFTGLFAFELLIKMVGFGSAFWMGRGWRWNAFDFFLVCISCMQELVSGNVSFMRILRVFRMIRVLRIVRVLRIFHELRRMAASIISAMASLSWAFLLLLLIMYIFAVFFMQGAVNWLQTELENEDFEANKEAIDAYFSSMFQSIYSLILAISGGSDWGDIAEPLGIISPWYTVAFVIYIIFVVFGVLNVLTGVFLESAAQIVDRDIITHAETQKQTAFAREMSALFEELDADGSGSLTWEELQEQLKDEKLRAYLNSQLLDSMDAHLFFKILQSQAGNSENDEITISDFIMGCARLKGQARSMHVLNLELELSKLKLMNKESMTVMSDQLEEINTTLMRMAGFRQPRPSTQ